MPSFWVEKILADLNERQREAVQHESGPLMVVAGAGTGKTRVVTYRIAYLIATKLARPEEILALTFTDKAAAEMEERVDQLVPYGYANVWISTFHAFGDRLLREFALELGLPQDFQVLSEAEQVIFFREHLFELPMKQFRPLSSPTQHIGAILKLISRAKDENVSPEDYFRYVEELRERAEAEPNNAELKDELDRQKELAEIYKAYQDLMLREGKIDFGDQVMFLLRLLREKPTVARQIRQRFRYILVDEFQDTNYAQFELVKELAREHRNVTVVADDDQSIYKFRGAAISNVLHFRRDFPDATVVVLTDNYRSTQEILDASYRLIRHNDPNRLEIRENFDKRLRSHRPPGPAVQHLHYDTQTAEADAVADIIHKHVEAGAYRYRDFAILVRGNRDADAYLTSLRMRDIPYQFSGSRGLYRRQEVRLLISLLQVLFDVDSSEHLYNLLSSEVYNFPMADLNRLLARAYRLNISLFDVLNDPDVFGEEAENGSLSPEAQATREKVLEDLRYLVEFSRQRPAGMVLYEFLERTGYLGRLARGEAPEAETKIQNLARFFDIVRAFSNTAPDDQVPHLVRYLDLLIEAGDDPPTAPLEPGLDAVNVLTVHKAKGLEFPVVFMVGLVKDKFPSRRRSDPLELPDALVREEVPSGDIHLQEERRLFYVGMTRAQQELYLTSADDYGGKRTRKVSPFVLEALDRREADVTPRKSDPIEVIRRHRTGRGATAPALEKIPASQPLQLSHMQVDDYLTCPLKYKYIHILRVPLRPHHTIIYGKAIHEAIQEYNRRRQAGLPVSYEDLLARFEGAWRNEGFLSREHEEQRLQAGREALRRFYEREQASENVPAYVEQEFAFWQGKNKITGRWDRVDERDGQVVIIDYKSSEVRDQKKADERARNSRQLAIYAIAYERLYGRMPDVLELHFVDTGLVGKTEPKPRKIEKTLEEIEQAAEGIRNREFSPTPSEWDCRYCPYNRICPATETKV
ncbi:MAG: UvrD-helicase domain-containing protein [Calditrichaeota bacterium]|nr:UvrD-helicase domain-containing protein [Calditrichota bacterium]